MAHHQRTQLLQKEGRISLAVASFRQNPTQAKRALAAAYDVPESTLRTRLRGVRPKREIRSSNRKLLPSEEQALVQWILDLDRRGFPPLVIDVRRMADVLLAARGQNPPPPPIGQCWATRFVQAQSELQTKWNRKRDSQRAKCEDPVAFSAWFRLVQDTRCQYGIPDEDIYNFDETGFMMGVAATSKVVTSMDTVGRAVNIQPGNRDWVTTIEGINAAGWAIPPFIILSGKRHQSSWYSELPAGYMVAVSDNGWTTDVLGLQWLQHFERHTASRTQAAYRLLIVDGHSSHATPEFDQYCTEHKIVTLCMPAHSSHLLQPLDVGCFSPLKHAYGVEIQDLARQGVYHIDKQEFLSTYIRIRPRIYTKENIQSSFQATGLVPLDAERVISCLPAVRTPSPPRTGEVAWTAETPRTVDQLEKQARLVNDLLRRSSQSPSSQAIAQLIKGCQLAMHSATILAAENVKLRATNERRQRRSQRRHYIQSGGALEAEQGRLLSIEAERIATEVDQVRTPGRQRAPPTCSNCHVQGHRRSQCTHR